MKTNLMILALLISTASFSQKNAGKTKDVIIPLVANRWQGKEGTYEFLEYKGVPAMKLTSSFDNVVLTDFTFTNGTIMFDIEPEDPNFAGIYFRRQSGENSEYFYLRVEGGKDPGAMWAIQYAPVVKNVNLWDLLDHYQAPAAFGRGKFNKVKLVVSGEQMLAYVNDMTTPAMVVPKLEGDAREGGLAFVGKGIIANLVVKPGETEGLSPIPGIDPTYRDPRYIRQWNVSQPVAFPLERDVTPGDFPKEGPWTDLSAERRGLMNLTRQFGSSAQGRRLVWLKVQLNVDKDQVRTVDLGFSDEVWVFTNDGLVYVDKNLYGAPIRKRPDGRCTPENGQFELPLKAGLNDVFIAVTNNFFGWAIIARLDAISGITVVNK